IPVKLPGSDADLLARQIVSPEASAALARLFLVGVAAGERAVRLAAARRQAAPDRDCTADRGYLLHPARIGFQEQLDHPSSYTPKRRRSRPRTNPVTSITRRTASSVPWT